MQQRSAWAADCCRDSDSTVSANRHSIDLTVAKEACGAIIFAFLPSQFGGDALADVILGDYSPAGRLPVTFYGSDLQDWFDPTDMSLRQGNGVTYMHHRGSPLFEYGCECRNGRLGPLTVAETLTRPFRVLVQTG